MTVLATQEDLLENVLECIPVGEFAVVQPLSEEFCLVLGYLLTWKLILTFFKAASSQVNVTNYTFLYLNMSCSEQRRSMGATTLGANLLGAPGGLPSPQTSLSPGPNCNLFSA